MDILVTLTEIHNTYFILSSPVMIQLVIGHGNIRWKVVLVLLNIHLPKLPSPKNVAVSDLLEGGWVEVDA